MLKKKLQNVLEEEINLVFCSEKLDFTKCLSALTKSCTKNKIFKTALDPVTRGVKNNRKWWDMMKRKHMQMTCKQRRMTCK